MVGDDILQIISFTPTKKPSTLWRNPTVSRHLEGAFLEMKRNNPSWTIRELESQSEPFQQIKELRPGDSSRDPFIPHLEVTYFAFETIT